MLSFRGQNRLRMKLHAFDCEFLVPESHDFVLRGTRAYFESRWDRIGIDNQRMIAHRIERTRQPREDRVAVVNHRRRLAMHQPRCAHDLAAERLPDTLMTEADAENRHLPRHPAQNLHATSRLALHPRARP